GREARVVPEAEVHYGLGGAPVPRGGNPAGQPEPRRAPGSSPRVAQGGRLVVGGERLGDGDRLAGRRPDLDVERSGLSIESGPDALSQRALESMLDQAPVVVHGILRKGGTVGRRETRTRSR